MIRKEISVVYVNRSLMSKDGDIQIPTDKVLVKIKSNNKIEDILNILKIDFETFSRLGSDKNSYMIELKNGKSIEVANLLYESGYFEYAQPSFTRFNLLLNEYYDNQFGLNTTEQSGDYLSISPNPAKGETTVTIESTPEGKVVDGSVTWDLEVYTQNQSMKYRKTKQFGKTTTINVSGWPEGIYIVVVKYDRDILTGKLVVNN